MRKPFSLLLVMFLLLTVPASAQMAKFKALFLFNFAQNIGWPEYSPSGEFIITVIGDTEIINELNEFSRTRTIGGNKLVVKNAEKLNEISSSHIIYLASDQGGLLPGILSANKGQPVLIVGDRQGLCREGAGITFIMEEGKLRSEISPQNIEPLGLTIASRLLTLGNEVR